MSYKTHVIMSLQNMVAGAIVCESGETRHRSSESYNSEILLLIIVFMLV